MKKRLTGLLAILLIAAMFLWACGTPKQESKDTSEASEQQSEESSEKQKEDTSDESGQETASFNMKDFEGVYAEKISHKGIMKLLAKDQSTAEITVIRDKGNNENYHWVMTGTYDEDKSAILYDDAKLVLEKYASDGKKSEETVYTNGTGKFAVSTTGISWTDELNKEDNDGTVFVYQADSKDYEKVLEELAIVPVFTAVPSGTVKPTITVSPTVKPTVTVRPTATVTPTAKPTETATPTKTATPEPTKTTTPEPTKTTTPKPTKTATPEPTKTTTPEPTKTTTPEPTETVTPEPTETVTPEPTETATPEPTETVTPEPTETVTPEPTETVTPEPTETVTPEPTVTPVVNPWTYTEDAKEAEKIAGFAFDMPEKDALPDDLAFKTFGAMKNLFEIQYAEKADNDGDKKPDTLTLRKSDTISGKELPGDKNKYKENWSVTIEAKDASGDTVKIVAKCSGADEKINRAVYHYDDFHYALICNPGENGEGISEDEFTELICSMHKLETADDSEEDPDESSEEDPDESSDEDSEEDQEDDQEDE